MLIISFVFLPTGEMLNFSFLLQMMELLSHGDLVEQFMTGFL